MRSLPLCHLTVVWEQKLCVKCRRALSWYAVRKLQSQERCLDETPENESSVGVDAFPGCACQRKWYCLFIKLAY